jgi:hypothetical protein
MSIYLAHHRTEKKERPGHLAKVVGAATRKRVRPYMAAHSKVGPSPLPCLFRLLFPRGDGYILVK